MLDNIAQAGIFAFGVTSVLLISYKNRWGFVVGLLSQPFWFTSAILNKQWGIVAINCVYLVVWSLGVYNWFFKKEQVKESEKI